MRNAVNSVNQWLVRIALTLAACFSPLDMAWSDGQGELNTPGLETFDLWASGLKLLLILAVVLGIMYGFIWFLRRMSRNGGLARGPRRVRVVDRVFLAPKRSIEAVAVGERVFLLGVTDSQIGLIAELDGSERAEFLAEADKKDSRSSEKFSSALKRATGFKTQSVNTAPSGLTSRADVRRIIDRARLSLSDVFRRARGLAVHDRDATAQNATGDA